MQKKMFLQKFDILINKQAGPITNFNDEVTKLPSGDDITRFDGSCQAKYLVSGLTWYWVSGQVSCIQFLD
jgi:hypothetical protein